jgi:hypothetical protein
MASDGGSKHRSPVEAAVRAITNALEPNDAVKEFAPRLVPDPANLRIRGWGGFPASSQVVAWIPNDALRVRINKYPLFSKKQRFSI